MKRKFFTGIALSSILLLSSQTAFADEIEDLKSKIEKTESKINSLEEEKNAVSMTISEIENALNTLKEEIYSINTQIKNNEEQIKKLSKEIKSKEKEIKALEKQLEEKKEMISRNLRLMESKGDIPFVEYLFTAENLPDLFSRFNNLKDVAKANETIYEEIRLKNEEVKEEKIQLERNRVQVELKKKELIELQTSLKTKEEKQSSLLKEYEKQYSKLEEEINSQEAAINHINSQISSIIAQREAERKKRAEEEARKKAEAEVKGEEYVTTLSSDLIGSGFTSPMSVGSYYTSSEYGWRTHPVYGTQRLHAGIDLAAPVGANIYAADSGTVIYSGAASGYGYWIVIDHNNGYFSIYAHMYANQLYVSVGEQVQKGQHIADVGSSGTSTGPHLHFEISKGGISSAHKINPRNFIRF